MFLKVQSMEPSASGWNADFRARERVYWLGISVNGVQVHLKRSFGTFLLEPWPHRQSESAECEAPVPSSAAQFVPL